MKKTIEKLKIGFKKIQNIKFMLLIPIAYLLAVVIITYYGQLFLLKSAFPFSSDIFIVLFYIFMIELLIIGIVLIIIKIGTPRKTKNFERLLKEINFVDNNGEPPILLNEEKLKNGSTFTFFSQKISILEFIEQKERIENALNIKIISMNLGRTMQHIIVNAITKFNAQKNIIRWSDNILSKKDFELVIGESAFGDEIIDISITPHLLIGGGTNSGKSVLLKSLLMQSVKKGAEVHIIDFKGGVDYNNDFWHKNCNIITDINNFNNELDRIMEIMESRKKLLFEAKVTNIKEYIIKTEKDIPRIIIAVDEIAEVLDKTGLNKEEKEFVSQIESKLSTFARLSRAMGIHLILCTQRPDADLLKGQIKSNLGYRICGRADEILSKMILDTPDAAEMISTTDQGMFYTNTKVLFKGFYIDDSDLKEVVVSEEKRNR